LDKYGQLCTDALERISHQRTTASGAKKAAELARLSIRNTLELSIRNTRKDLLKSSSSSSLSSTAKDNKNKRPAESNAEIMSAALKKKRAVGNSGSSDPKNAMNENSIPAAVIGGSVTPSKKKKDDERPASTKKKDDERAAKCQAFVGRRVAKFFHKVIYFGRVNHWCPPDLNEEGIDLWRVYYDDNDLEDFDRSDLDKALARYAKYKAEDTKKKVA
jgi:hypothetical protein